MPVPMGHLVKLHLLNTVFGLLSQQSVCTCADQRRWHGDEVGGRCADILVFILQECKQTPPKRQRRGQTCRARRRRLQKQTLGSRLMADKHSPSGSWGLLNTLPVQLTSTFAAVSFTSAGCSSLQHEHTSSPHLPKQATATTPWKQPKQADANIYSEATWLAVTLLPASKTSLLGVYTFLLWDQQRLQSKMSFKTGRFTVGHRSLPDSWNSPFPPPAGRPESERHSTAPHCNTQPGQQLEPRWLRPRICASHVWTDYWQFWHSIHL